MSACPQSQGGSRYTHSNGPDTSGFAKCTAIESGQGDLSSPSHKGQIPAAPPSIIMVEPSHAEEGKNSSRSRDPEAEDTVHKVTVDAPGTETNYQSRSFKNGVHASNSSSQGATGLANQPKESKQLNTCNTSLRKGTSSISSERADCVSILDNRTGVHATTGNSNSEPRTEDRSSPEGTCGKTNCLEQAPTTLKQNALQPKGKLPKSQKRRRSHSQSNDICDSASQDSKPQQSTSVPKNNTCESGSSCASSSQLLASASDGKITKHPKAGKVLRKNARPFKKWRHVPEGWKCSMCGADDTPVVRRGPTGNPELCNACGIRFSREQREMEMKSSAAAQAAELVARAISTPAYPQLSIQPPVSKPSDGRHTGPLIYPPSYSMLTGQHLPAPEMGQAHAAQPFRQQQAMFNYGMMPMSQHIAMQPQDVQAAIIQQLLRQQLEASACTMKTQLASLKGRPNSSEAISFADLKQFSGNWQLSAQTAMEFLQQGTQRNEAAQNNPQQQALAQTFHTPVSTPNTGGVPPGRKSTRPSESTSKPSNRPKPSESKKND